MTEYVDPLKSFTEKEYRILAAIETLKDEMWVNGMTMTIGDKEKIVNGDTYGKSIDEISKYWKGLFQTAITEDCWKDGKHMGDCTKCPCTCFRCLCEEHMGETRRVVEFFNTL